MQGESLERDTLDLLCGQLSDQRLNSYIDQRARSNCYCRSFAHVHPELLAVAPAVRKALADLDATLPLDEVMTYDQSIRENLAGQFYVAGLIGSDALIALLLAAIGIFGVMANLVGERTREIGVRLALGVRREDVLRMTLRRAAWLTGVCAGLLRALGLARMVANLLYQVRPGDPWVFGSMDCRNHRHRLSGKLASGETSSANRPYGGPARRVGVTWRKGE